MKERLLQALSRLASASYQETYMVSGSKDEYVVPEDLVEDVASLCRLAQRSEFARDFMPAQGIALSQMVSSVEMHGRRLFSGSINMTAAQLVRENPDWEALRRSAAACLATFGISAGKLRAEEIDRDV